MSRTAVILTVYNRPTLVGDAIQSILGQDDTDVTLYIMDDGSSAATRMAIDVACGGHWVMAGTASDGEVWRSARVCWWRGPARTMPERKSCISYSMTINIALNGLLGDERYICYLPDDDALYPEAVGARADYLDAHPDCHVVYGRMRSIQYGVGGARNEWRNAARPEAGVQFPRPTGPRQQVTTGGKWCFFAPTDTEQSDPQTGKPYVEEGFWEPGLTRYGIDGRTDHSQVMHRRSCLSECGITYPHKPDGSTEYWGEDIRHGVGDAAFFTLLATVHPFVGIDNWVNVKKFHALSDGVVATEIRE